MSDPHAKAQTPPKTTDRHDESLVPPVQSGDGGATGTGATVRGVPVPGVPVCASHQRETRKQKIARQQNAAAGRAADRVCDPIRAAIDAGELTIRPAASPEAADRLQDAFLYAWRCGWEARGMAGTSVPNTLHAIEAYRVWRAALREAQPGDQ